MATLSIQNASGQATSITPNASNTGILTLPAGTATILATPLPAGTTTIAPLTLTTGTNLATATAGALEYNGYSPYFTPTGTQRGIIQAAQYYALNSSVVGSNVNTAQLIFGVGVSLSSSTQYEFEMLVEFSKTAGATSHNFSLGFGGGATLNNISYNTFLNYNNTGFTTAAVTATPWFIQSASATAIISSIANANSYIFGLIKGIVSVNAGGTFNPQYTLSAAPGGAYTTAVGSYMKISPLAASGSNVSIGTWS